MESQSYLSFRLGKELYASNVSSVLNILDMISVTKVPKAPRYMKGVINLRGEVLPLVDARIKLGVHESEYTNNTCILVLDVKHDGDSTHIGAIVDSVYEVFNVLEEKIIPPPSLASSQTHTFLKGMIENQGEFVMLLDMDKVFAI